MLTFACIKYKWEKKEKFIFNLLKKYIFLKDGTAEKKKKDGAALYSIHFWLVKESLKNYTSELINCFNIIKH